MLRKMLLFLMLVFGLMKNKKLHVVMLILKMYYKKCIEKVKYITPVPGGLGALTVSFMM